MQNDVVAIYDVDGAIKAWYTYDAWGNVTGLLDTDVEKLNPIRYRGYYYDNETGYYYCQSRYYNPEWCRWISADVYMDTEDGILSTNMYAYCQNDPVNGVDPSGAKRRLLASVMSVDMLTEQIQKLYGYLQKLISEKSLLEIAATHMAGAFLKEEYGERLKGLVISNIKFDEKYNVLKGSVEFWTTDGRQPGFDFIIGRVSNLERYSDYVLDNAVENREHIWKTGNSWATNVDLSDFMQAMGHFVNALGSLQHLLSPGQTIQDELKALGTFGSYGANYIAFIPKY